MRKQKSSSHKLFSIHIHTTNGTEGFIRFIGILNNNKISYSTKIVEKINDATFYVDINNAKKKAIELSNKYSFMSIDIIEKNSGRVSKIKKQ